MCLVARELGVSHETLRNWVKVAERGQAKPADAASEDELRALRKRVAELEA
ncbi:transposase [Amycolatopsis sp. CB00013]|uniref:transposase n=1 Tax=Amycolatopsis sp. CB00013 TaxID=1703945 RepID=UPI0009F96EA0|nr:transposase [Amycolatopsis sp. CB00013]